jgi:hypothetical protein
MYLNRSLRGLARSRLRGLAQSEGYVGTNFGLSPCPPGWYQTNPGIAPHYCMQLTSSAPAPAPASAPVTVSPVIQTSISPQISPIFQQSYMPSGSPMTAGTAQVTPITQGAGAAAAPIPESLQPQQAAPSPGVQYVPGGPAAPFLQEKDASELPIVAQTTTGAFDLQKYFPWLALALAGLGIMIAISSRNKGKGT